VNEGGIENIIHALQHRDRTSEIHITDINGPALATFVSVMHGQLPALTYFFLRSTDESVQVLPETFMGGSAPLLQTFILWSIPFPSFPSLALTATHIVNLHLIDIPHSGYISPQVMATCVSILPNLAFLSFGFQSPLSRPSRTETSWLPLTRAVLPALTRLSFSGANEYFEDFLTRIDTPLLCSLSIVFFMDLIFHIPQLRNFVDHTKTLGSFNDACMELSGREVTMILGASTHFELRIKCERPDWQLSSITEVFGQLPLLSHVEQLEIRMSRWSPVYKWNGNPDMDSSQWLQLFHLLIAVQRLHISKTLVFHVASALQGLTDGVATGVFPALRNIFLEGLEGSGPVRQEAIKSIKSFVAIRQPSDHIAIYETPFAEICPFPDCESRYSRAQELQRHIRRHLPYYIYCPQPGCEWTGKRYESLWAHFKMKHPSIPEPGRERCIIYDSNVMVKQLLNNEITAEQAKHKAHLLFRRRAVELGKMGIWRE
jgi:hypothetical protein